MALPDATLTIRDGALGIVPAGGFGTVALVGTCSLGVVNTVYQFSDTLTLTATLGVGPLVEAAAHVLSIAGGPVVCCKVTSAAGTNGTIVNAGTGTSVMSFTGTPNDSYQVQVKVVQPGASPTAGTATFMVSLDGGRTFGAETALPVAGSYLVVGSGLTLVFGTGTLVAGDIYSATEVGPNYTTTNLNLAITALLADSTPWFLLWVVGVPATPTVTAAVFAALDSQLSTAAANYRYVRGLINAADDTDINVDAAMSALTSLRMHVAVGFAAVVSPISGNQYRREAAYLAASRAASIPPPENLGRVATGALQGVQALYRNEFTTPGMDAKRYITLRTHLGLPGFYITSGRTFSSPSSDYQYMSLGRVMDIASTVVRTAQLNYVNDTVRVNATTGFILETDALAIEARIGAQLRAALLQPKYVSAVSILVSRTEPMLITQILRIAYRITPLALARTVAGELAFSNPALLKVAA